MTDSEFFKDSHHTWPEGYTAMRKFISLKGQKNSSFRIIYIHQAFSVFGWLYLVHLYVRSLSFTLSRSWCICHVQDGSAQGCRVKDSPYFQSNDEQW